ncbi:MAG: hypothetical protein AAGK33_10360 [Pseudomonadota bacterium]
MTVDLNKRRFALMALMGAIPLTHMLDLGYGVFSFELLTITALFAFAGAVLAFLCRGSGLFGPIMVLALYWFLEVYFIKGMNPGVGGIFLLALLLSLEMKRIEEWFLPLVGVFAVFFSGTSLLKPGPQLLVSHAQASAARPAERAEKRPGNAVLQIIIDEQSSPLAMAHTIPDGHAAHGIIEDYRKRGFTVHGNTMAITKNTYESVSAMMNLTDKTDNYIKHEVGAAYTYSVKEDRLLQQMQDEGYKLSILQTNFLDICRDRKVEECNTYTRANNMGMFADFDLSYTRRLQVAAHAIYGDYTRPNFLSAVHIVQVADRYWHIANQKEEDRAGFFSRPLVVLKMMDVIRGKVDKLEGGDVHIAHLLLPHFPYVLNADCSFKPMEQWTNPARYSSNPDLSHAYEGFWDQAVCTHKHLMGIVDAAIAKGNVDVMIHGDHGARISQSHATENDTDLRMTMMAVRRAGVTGEGQVVTAQQNLQKVYIDEIGSIVSTSP